MESSVIDEIAPSQQDYGMIPNISQERSVVLSTDEFDSGCMSGLQHLLHNVFSRPVRSREQSSVRAHGEIYKDTTHASRVVVRRRSGVASLASSSS